MIERYTLPEMAELWSERKKFEKWLEVELAIVDGLAFVGKIPWDVASQIRSKARFDETRIAEIEKRTKHDLLAFVESVAESLGGLSRYFHMGVTSSDILDTSLALLIRESCDLICSELEVLSKILSELAKQHCKTLIVGRTHGVHAEPTSLGLKFAVWRNEVIRSNAAIKYACKNVAVGKISGSVGNYAHIPPEVEDYVLEKLRLGVERPASQIVQRDRHAQLICAIAIAGGVLERIATEIRNLQRTEIAEMEEPFTKGQKGSSSMPHKRNPITLERICGLSRLLRSYVVSALENIALWHERDISHSSAERVIIPDATTLLHYMARAMREVLADLKIDVSRMRANVDLTKGAIFSQRLMLELLEAGWTRLEAYDKVQKISHQAASLGLDLKTVVLGDSEISEVLDKAKIEEIFDPEFYLRYAEVVLRQLGVV